MGIPFSDIMKKGGYDVNVAQQIDQCGCTAMLASKNGEKKFYYAVVEKYIESERNKPAVVPICKDRLQKFINLAKYYDTQSILILKETPNGTSRYISCVGVKEREKAVFDWETSEVIYLVDVRRFKPLYDENTDVFSEVMIQGSLTEWGGERCQKSLIV
jgi:hypothetical protein